MNKFAALPFILFSFSSLGAAPAKSAKGKAPASNATAMIERSENHMRGKTFAGKMTMIIESPSANRTLSMRVWSVGKEKAFIKILSPAKDRDTGNLRLGTSLWQYLPHVDKIIKVPTSLMLQSWMGSDFTNDDLVKTSSLTRDYTHKLLGETKYETYNAVKIECNPKPNAPVVWGKIVAWVRKEDAAPLRQDFYGEGGTLLKSMLGSKLKSFGSHTIPTVFEMHTVAKKDAKTTLRYDEAVYDKGLDDSIFTQENLRKPVRE
jgi:outer membrane lipoprotein-sorting protein